MARRPSGPETTRVRWLAGAPALAVIVAACGAGADASAALPASFDGGFYEVVEGPGPEGVTLEAQLSADDGTQAVLTLQVTAPPPAEASDGSGSVECDGEAVQGPLVQDDAGGSGSVDIDGLGTATLTIEHNRAVAPAPGAPPLCTEHTGTWTGTGGELEGREGTFVTVGHHAHRSLDEQTAQLTMSES